MALLLAAFLFFEELSVTAGTLSAAALTGVRANADGTAVVKERIVRRQAKTGSAEAARSDDGDDPVTFTAPEPPTPPTPPIAPTPPTPPPPSTPPPPPSPPIAPNPPVPNPPLPEGFDDDRLPEASSARNETVSRAERAFGAGFASFLARRPLAVLHRDTPMQTLPFHPCRKPCVNRGRCNFQTGKCDCPSGYKGATCAERDAFACDDADGRAVTSRCAGTCDLTNNRCQCGSETPYPNRQIGSWCQPDLARDRGVPREAWRDPRAFTSGAEPLPYHWVFGVAAAEAQANLTETFARGEVDDEVTRGTKAAWCFANMSSETESARGALEPAALCALPCPAGTGNAPDCDAALPGTYCPNQCSGRGECVGGFCACAPEWWGADCSLSADADEAGAPIPQESEGFDKETSPGDSDSRGDVSHGAAFYASARAPRRRASPLVYVYEIDPEFHSGQHQRRKQEHDCVPRLYGDESSADDSLEGPEEKASRWYYSLETTFHEFLSRSAHRTTDPAEADYFFAPIASACFHLRYNRPSPRHWAADLPIPSRPFGVFTFWDAYARELRRRLRDPAIAAARLKRGYATPTLTSADDDDSTIEGLLDVSDHLFVTPYDEGACFLPPSLRTGVFLTHWGNDGSTHARSTAGFGPDRWQSLLTPRNLLRGWRCYDPAKDLVVPPWNRRVAKTTAVVTDNGSATKSSSNKRDFADPRFWARGKRNYTFFFAGDLGTAEGIPRSGPHADPRYSLGIRQRVTKVFRDREDEGFVIAGHLEETYDEMLRSSTFCGAFPGDGWSGGVLAYLKFGCVPVIVLDGVDMPFERVGAWRSPNGTLGLGKDTEWAPFDGVTYGDSRSELDTSAELDTSDVTGDSPDTTFSEPLLDYASFSVRVAERDVENMDVILKRFTDSEIRDLQRGVENVRALFSYDVPDQPARGPARRPAAARGGETETYRKRVGKGDDFFGENQNASELARLAGGGAADVAEPGVWGGGVGLFPGVPWDAFEMIMASLRYKLELRDREKGGEGGS
jgi:hypothetical protein